MLNKISLALREKIKSFTSEDSILFNGQVHKINPASFAVIPAAEEKQSVTFIDGGQAEIFTTGNFCLSLIRIVGITMQNGKKTKLDQNEFYALSTASYRQDELWYEAKIFPIKGEQLIEEKELVISSTDGSICSGRERAPLERISGIIRRLAELSLAAKCKSQSIILDGTLQPTYPREEKYLSRLSENCCGLAKTSSLFTIQGNNPLILFQKISPAGCWSYHLWDKTYFIKLHPQARHVFRFEGNIKSLPDLVENSTDPLFLGYPYGLILADRLARISNVEKATLRTKFLLRNPELLEYFHAQDAHDILDNMG